MEIVDIITALHSSVLQC